MHVNMFQSNDRVGEKIVRVCLAYKIPQLMGNCVGQGRLSWWLAGWVTGWLLVTRKLSCLTDWGKPSSPGLLIQ